MADIKHIPTSIDEYMLQFPEDVRAQLSVLREAIHKAAPDAAEKISWGMPAFWQSGDLVYFAAHKRHIGFYPGAVINMEFVQELKPYKTSKGAVQFPYGQPLPLELIGRIVVFRLAENLRDAAERDAARAAAKAERAGKKEKPGQDP